MTMRDYGSFDCERFGEHLMDHIEGDDDAATRARMDAHAASCADCRALLADVRRISRDAAELPTLAPSRDLWPEIAARIEAPVIAIPQLGALDASRRPRRVMPAWLRPAAAAAALVIATASITYIATHRAERGPQIASAPVTPTTHDTATRPATTLAQRLAAAPDTQSRFPNPDSRSSVPGARSAAPEPAASNPAAIAVVNHGKKLSPEATYDIEIRRLREIVRQRRTQLDTATLNVIEHNLKIIDDAIAQCRAALARDPNSAFLLDNLNGALDTKVQLLRTAAMLPART